MGLFEIGKKKQGYRCTQYGLFNNVEFDVESFIDAFEKDWGIKLEAEIKNDDMITHIHFDIDKIQFVCSFMKASYPDESPIEAAKRNPFWRKPMVMIVKIFMEIIQ